MTAGLKRRIGVSIVSTFDNMQQLAVTGAIARNCHENGVMS